MRPLPTKPFKAWRWLGYLLIGLSTVGIGQCARPQGGGVTTGAGTTTGISGAVAIAWSLHPNSPMTTIEDGRGNYATGRALRFLFVTKNGYVVAQDPAGGDTAGQKAIRLSRPPEPFSIGAKTVYLTEYDENPFPLIPIVWKPLSERKNSAARTAAIGSSPPEPDQEYIVEAAAVAAEPTNHEDGLTHIEKRDAIIVTAKLNANGQVKYSGGAIISAGSMSPTGSDYIEIHSEDVIKTGGGRSVSYRFGGFIYNGLDGVGNWMYHFSELAGGPPVDSGAGAFRGVTGSTGDSSASRSGERNTLEAVGF